VIVVTNYNDSVAPSSHYQPKPFNRVIFAADFHNYNQELGQVVEFARALNAPIEGLPFLMAGEAIPDKEIIEDGIKTEFSYPVSLHIEVMLSISLVHDLQRQIELSKPSVMIMFTDQSRTLFQEIFLSSKA